MNPQTKKNVSAKSDPGKSTNDIIHRHLNNKNDKISEDDIRKSGSRNEIESKEISDEIMKESDAKKIITPPDLLDQ
jgi:hypothetical protein